MPHFDKPRFVMQDNPKQSAYGMMIAIANFYLDEGDIGYDESFITIKDIGDGYKGEMKELVPVDQNDFDKWYESLPDKIIQEPLCDYVIYPPYNINPEETLWCFQYALDEMYRKHCAGKKIEDINLPVKKTSAFKTQYEAKVAELKSADFSKVKNAELYKVK